LDISKDLSCDLIKSKISHLCNFKIAG